MMTDDMLCPKCKSELRCLGGHSAHPSNWYCEKCDDEDVKGNTTEMIKLVADCENGEGEIEFAEDYDDYSPLLRADIIRDWIYDLRKAYDEAIEELHDEESKTPISKSAIHTRLDYEIDQIEDDDYLSVQDSVRRKMVLEDMQRFLATHKFRKES